MALQITSASTSVPYAVQLVSSARHVSALARAVRTCESAHERRDPADHGCPMSESLPHWQAVAQADRVDNPLVSIARQQVYSVYVMYAICLASLRLMQDEATKLKQASSAEKKADLAKRVAAYPKRLQEAVALTAEDDIFLNHIGDR